MKRLPLDWCTYVTGGDFSTTTEVITSNPHINCHCVCVNTAEQIFIEESDDVWVWWLIARPYHLFADFFTKIFY